MKNQVFSLSGKNPKSFGYTDEKIFFSSKSHKTIHTLTSANPGLMETVKVIPFSDVTGVKFSENDDYNFEIIYDQKGKSKSKSVTLESRDSRTPIVEELVQMKDFSVSTETESKNKPLLINIGLMAFIAFLTWALRDVAIDAQNGIAFEASGRRSGSKKLMAWVADLLGPTGVLLVGIAIIGLIGYMAFKRFKNPALEHTYS